MPQSAMPFIAAISAAASLAGTVGALTKDKPKQKAEGINLDSPNAHDNSLTLASPQMNAPSTSYQQPQLNTYTPQQMTMPSDLSSFYNQLNATQGFNSNPGSGVF